ncbi:MAG TPA: SUF system NifU family Fe-S cluster assembly protein [Bacteroidota bacterium]|nr:SUF system NifU family Fe-S cluster assembly protein [Bacteroidota bacterium]
MKSDVRSLYQEIILDHNKSPRNFRAMEDATRVVDGYNPLCGDHYTVYLKMNDERIEDISFTGSGCAISKASASVMSSMIKGKTKTEAAALFTTFHDLVTGTVELDGKIEELGRLAAFAGVSEFPARVKCASLAWHTMKGALESTSTTVSTE